MAFTAAGVFELIGGAAVAYGAAGALAPGGGGRLAIPPSPVIPQTVVDQSAQEAENTAKRRQQLAGGILSTVGTAGGEAGSVMNPSTISQASLLGR